MGMSLPMRNLSNFRQNCCHSLGEQLMSTTGRSRRGWRLLGAGAAGKGAAGRGTWFAMACVIMDPIAPTPAGQEKSQPSYSHVTEAMVGIIAKSQMFTSSDGRKGVDRRMRGAASTLDPNPAAGRLLPARRTRKKKKARGRPRTSQGSRPPASGSRPLAGDEGGERS